MRTFVPVAVAALLSAHVVDSARSVATAEERPRAGSDCRVLAPSGAWVWFTDPRAVYSENQQSTYAGWINASGDVRVGGYDHQTGEITRATLHERIGADDHDTPSLLPHPDGRLTAFYSAHNGPALYYRTTKRPGDLRDWNKERRLPVNTSGGRGYTYPSPFRLAGEKDRVYLFWRGGDYKPNFSFSDDPRLAAESWAPARTLIRGDGARPYVKYASDGEDTIHIAFTDGHPRKEAHNSIYYMRYHDGGLHKADGGKIVDLGRRPVAPREADVVYDGRRTGVRAWVWDIAADDAGRPVIVYATLPRKTDHRYRYARWTGERWIDHEITPAGPWFPQTPAGETEKEPHYSGGIDLDPEDPSTVYLSRRVEGVFEIERWTTGDGGETWARHPITRGSEKNNVRPVVPLHHPEGRSPASLLWMHGDYVHYTRYETSIRMIGPGRKKE